MDLSARPFSAIEPSAKGSEAIWQVLEKEPRWAMDVEADSFYRYFEKVCLLQFSTPDADYFFDPLTYPMPDRLRRLLTSLDRTLIVHGADFDIRVLKSSFDLSLGQIFDTNLAARLLGMERFGLKALLASELGVEIDKQEQRSDWSRRPLSASQLQYARQDTMHLLDLARVLEDKLRQAGRLEWLEEECKRLLTVEPTVKVFDPEGWRKIKGAKDLGERGRQVLAALFSWRDHHARRTDKAPFRVIRNEVLLRLAKTFDEQGHGLVRRLSKLRFLPRNIPTEEVVATIEAAFKQPVPSRYRPLKSPKKTPKPSVSKKTLEHLKAKRDDWSQDLHLDPGFLLPLSTLERVAREKPPTTDALRRVEGLTNWRVDILGARLMAALTVMEEPKE